MHSSALFPRKRRFRFGAVRMLLRTRSWGSWTLTDAEQGRACRPLLISGHWACAGVQLTTHWEVGKATHACETRPPGHLPSSRPLRPKNIVAYVIQARWFGVTINTSLSGTLRQQLQAAVTLSSRSWKHFHWPR